MKKEMKQLAMGAALTATALTGYAQVEMPANDDIHPEPARTQPLKLIEPELPVESVDRTPVAFENGDSKLKLSGNRKAGGKLKAVVVAGPMHSTKEATHFEMYDGEKYVKENVGVIKEFLDKHPR